MITTVLSFILTFILILIRPGDAKGRTQKPCPAVLPDGPMPLRDIKDGQTRIINGEVASKLFSYMGALKSNGELICSATLLSEYWALTAAHCLFNPNITIFVTGGDRFDNGVETEIEKGIIHEMYPVPETNFINDIQLIKLKKPAPPTARFVRLNIEPSIPASLSFVRTAGFGDTLGTAFPKSGLLRQVDVPVQPMNVCKKQYEGISILLEYHICAGYFRGGCDSCTGDSGGPLFTFDRDLNVIQVGIVSFGFKCARPHAAGVYSKVSSQIGWLRRKGAVFQTSSSGVDVFANPETGAPFSDGQKVESDNISAETETMKEEEEAEENEFPSPDESPQEMKNVNDDKVSSSSSMSQGECFPINASVTLEGGYNKHMGDLLVGDSVQVGPGEFSRVFMFTHRKWHGTYRFVRITSSASEDSLLLTAGHMLLLNGMYKQAGMAKAGDIVQLGDGRAAEIIEVDYVFRTGLFNPQTVDGRIVVNGIVSSSYTTSLDIKTAHAVLAPLRCFFTIFKRDCSKGVLDDGFPSLSPRVLNAFGFLKTFLKDCYGLVAYTYWAAILVS